MTTKQSDFSMFVYETAEFRDAHGEWLTLEQMAVLAGVHATLLEIMLDRELVSATVREGDVHLHVSELQRIRKILRLHFDLGIGWSSMELVVHLLDRIDELERELAKKS
jgi:hypothetical protein